MQAHDQMTDRNMPTKSTVDLFLGVLYLDREDFSKS